MHVSFPAQLSDRAKHLLKRIRVVVVVLQQLKRCPDLIRYYIPRALGWATYPILRTRAPLRGYHNSTRDLLKHGGVSFIEPAPTLEEQQSAPCDPSASRAFVAIIPGGRSVYDSGAVVEPDHKLLADVSWQDLVHEESLPMFHPAMRKMYLPKLRPIRGSVAVISSALPGNYYHWMFDIVPRFDILHRSGLVPDYYLVNDDTQFQQDSLRLLNIPSSKIIRPTLRTHIQADQLIVPSLPGPPFSKTPKAHSCRFLRTAFLGEGRKQTPYRLLYITRNDAKERRVVNEAEVRRVILPLGFDLITLTGMPFAEQIELFSQARVILGPHGAGFANAVFCQPGTALIEFMPQGREIDCFERLAGFIGLDYHVIFADDRTASGLPAVFDDHLVDIDVLKHLLHRVL